MWVSYTDNQSEQTTARQSAGAGEIKEISMDRDTIIDGLRMTMDLCVFDPSTGEEIEPHLLNDINRATYDACKGALEILERLDTDPNTISRAKAIKEVTRNIPVKGWDDAERVTEIMKIFADRLKQLPPAQPERIKGRWIAKEKKNLFRCSKCDAVIYSESEYDRNEFHKFCGRCGADMRGEQDE